MQLVYNKKPDPTIYLPNIYSAIERGRALDNHEEDYPTGLGTHVYRLVEKLVKEQKLAENES